MTDYSPPYECGRCGKHLAQADVRLLGMGDSLVTWVGDTVTEISCDGEVLCPECAPEHLPPATLIEEDE